MKRHLLVLTSLVSLLGLGLGSPWLPNVRPTLAAVASVASAGPVTSIAPVSSIAPVAPIDSVRRAPQRLIVELDGAPVSEWAAALAGAGETSASLSSVVDSRLSTTKTTVTALAPVKGEPPLFHNARLDVTAPAAERYEAQLAAQQYRFAADLAAHVPGATVATFRDDHGLARSASYRLLLNAVAVEVAPGTDLSAAEAAIRRLPGVTRIAHDRAHSPSMYASLPLINIDAVWNLPSVGGQQHAGAGVKLASMDGGVHKDALMFSGTGYTYPRGYPLGDLRDTNGKIIVARAYFRTWDPPSAGDENPWPGTRGTPHGVHTAATAAGNAVDADYDGVPVKLSGVAPRAYLMSYRVFYNSITNDGSFYDVEGVAALEDLTRDGADVVNNSWGSGPASGGGDFDAIDHALLNAWRAGVFVSMANGNAGPNPATGDHPSAEYINVAASSTSGTFASGRLNVIAPAPVPATLTGIGYGGADFGAPLPPGRVVGPFKLKAGVAISETNILGCEPWPAGSFAGRAALIQRGTCDFSLKVLNAERAGAEFVIIYNPLLRGDAVLTMGAGAGADQVTISAILVGHTKGQALVDWYTANPDSAMVEVNTIPFQVGNTPDVIADFSSRGPGVGNVLKPDIAAPGVNILSQGFATGVGEARHLGFGQASGTSMAAPHVAGAGAMLKQVHPNWPPAWIKSALMSTSKYTGITNGNGKTAQPLDMGAGRLDMTHAADPGIILNPPSLSFGAVATGTLATLTFTVLNITPNSETYVAEALYTGGTNPRSPLPGARISPNPIIAKPNTPTTVSVEWDTRSSRGYGDNQGYLHLQGGQHDAHLPMWMRVAYPTANAEVLVVDNDGSSLGVGTDYAPYYTATLAALGHSYEVWDADLHGQEDSLLPDGTTMARYHTILYESGDNSQVGPNGTDLDALTEYANNGGHLVVFGQDAAALFGVTSPTASPLVYGYTLGARWLQDSVSGGVVFTTTAQMLSGVPRSAFSDQAYDISSRLAGTGPPGTGEASDGAGNLSSIDEIDQGNPQADSTADFYDQFLPLLKYASGGDFTNQGYVATGHRTEPSLERPGRTFFGRAMYFAFGLEGVNSNTGFNTRQDLLDRALSWLNDDATVTITPTVKPSGEVSMFMAAMQSTMTGHGVGYRWDFGDGSPFTPMYRSATAGHTYRFGGRRHVRVEVTNALGTRAVYGIDVMIPDGQRWLLLPNLGR